MDKAAITPPRPKKNKAVKSSYNKTESVGWEYCIVRDLLYLTFGFLVIILSVAVRRRFLGWFLEVITKNSGKKRDGADPVDTNSNE